MKKFVIVALFAPLPFLFGSCEKCQKCSYSYTDTNGQEITSEVGETCGEQSQLDQLELDCEDAAQIVGGTCECSN